MTNSLHQMRMPIGVALLAAASCAISNDVLNQTENQHAVKSPVMVMEKMVITANRIEKPLSSIPNTVTVIDQNKIQHQTGIIHDLSTLLGNLLPSFTPGRQKLSGAGETLRGRSPLFLIDGVPQSNPLRDGSRDGHTIDPALIERIEVIHGANAIHGMGASGGVINLITRNPPQEFEQSIQVDMNGSTEGNNDALGYGLLYSAAGQLGAWDLLTSIGHRNTGVFLGADGEMIGVDTTQGDLMDSRSNDYFVKLGYNWDAQSLHLMANHFNLEGSNDWLAVSGDFDAGIPSSSVKGSLEGKAPSNKVTTVSLDYRADEILGQQLHLQLFSQTFTAVFGAGIFNSFQDPLYGDDLVEQSRINADKTGIKLTLSQQQVFDLPINWVYGLDLLRDKTDQDLVQTGRQWVPLARYDNYAPFLQLEYTGLEHLLVTVGMRNEHSTLQVNDFNTIHRYGNQQVAGGDPKFSENLYNVGVTYALSDALRIFSNYAEGYSMPDVGRVLRAIDEPNLDVDTFLNLQPIVSENSELGVEFHKQRWSAQLSYYQSDSDFGSRLEASSDGIFGVKRERTEITGLEGSAELRLNHKTDMGFMYSNPKGKFDASGDGKVDTDLPGLNIAPERLNLYWKQRWHRNIESRLQLSHFFNRSFDDTNDVEKDSTFSGYNSLDLTGTFPLTKGQLQASVQNLTNEDYFTYYSQTAENDKRNFKGLGRSFNLSYRHTF